MVSRLSVVCTTISRGRKRVSFPCTRVKIQFFITNYSKDSEGNESESLVRAWSGDVSADSRLAVTANDDCTLKFYALQGMKNR